MNKLLGEVFFPKRTSSFISLRSFKRSIRVIPNGFFDLFGGKMEYYYDRRQKRWTRVSDRSCPISEEKLSLLRDNKENKKHFLIVKTADLYPGLHTDLVYFDIADVKLLLDGGNRVFLKYNDVFVKSKTQIRKRWIKNPGILKTIQEDMDSVVEFVEDVSYLHHMGISVKNNTIHNNYWSLSPEAQLYYQMEGNRLDLI